MAFGGTVRRGSVSYCFAIPITDEMYINNSTETSNFIDVIL